MCKFACEITSSDCTIPLGVEIWLDNQCLLNADHVTQLLHFEHEFEDDSSDHSIRWVLKHKKSEHTKIDHNGNITQDATISLSNFVFEDLDCMQLLLDHSTYIHDFNGADPTVDKFYGKMGCNGTVELKFTTPVYFWMLERL